MDRDPPEDRFGLFRGQPDCPLLGKLCGISLKAGPLRFSKSPDHMHHGAVGRPAVRLAQAHNEDAVVRYRSVLSETGGLDRRDLLPGQAG